MGPSNWLLEKSEHYRKLAIEAETTAEGMPPSAFRSAYVRIAEDWSRLALEFAQPPIPTRRVRLTQTAR
jgi:hypothetical protein